MESFLAVNASYSIHIPPEFSGRLQVGILQKMHALLLKYPPWHHLRYNQDLAGIPVSISKIKLDEPSASILADNPYFHLPVTLDLCVWRPQPGGRLPGVINRISPDHVGLVVFGFINASIPASSLRPKYYYEVFAKTWIASSRSGHTAHLQLSQELSFYISEVVHLTKGQISLMGTL